MIIDLLGYILGFSVSISVVYLFIVTFGSSLRGSRSIFLVFVLFAVSQLAGAFAFFHPRFLFLVYLFEMLSFLLLYYRYLRKDLMMLSIPLIILSDAFLVISLYFVIYDLLVFYKMKGRADSRYIFLAFYLFILSLVLSMYNGTLLNSDLLASSITIIFDLAIVLFIVPIFKSLMYG